MLSNIFDFLEHLGTCSFAGACVEITKQEYLIAHLGSVILGLDFNPYPKNLAPGVSHCLSFRVCHLGFVI